MKEEISTGEGYSQKKTLDYNTIDFKNPDSNIQTLTTQHITNYHPEVTLSNKEKTYQKNNDVTVTNTITINTNNSNNETIKNSSLNNLSLNAIKEKKTGYVDLNKLLNENEPIYNNKIYFTEANVIKKNSSQTNSTRNIKKNLKSNQSINIPKNIVKYETPKVRLRAINDTKKESSTCKKTNINSKTKMLDNLSPVIYSKKVENRNNLSPLQNRLKYLEEEIQKQNEYDYKRIMKELETQYENKKKANEQKKEIELKNQKFQEKLKIMEEHREKLLKDKIKKIQERQKIKLKQYEKFLNEKENSNDLNENENNNLTTKEKAQMIRQMQKEEEDNFCFETEEKLKFSEKEHRKNYIKYLKKMTQKLKECSDKYNERNLNCINTIKDNEELREENFLAQDMIKRYNYSQNVEREKSAKKIRIKENLQKNMDNLQEKRELLEKKEKEKIQKCIKRLNRKKSIDNLRYSHDHYLFTDEKRQFLAEKQKENLIKTKEEDNLRMQDYIWDQGYYVGQLKKMQNKESKKQDKVLKNIINYQKEKDMKYQSYFDAVDNLSKNNIMNQDMKMRFKLYNQKKKEDKKREELEKEKREEENQILIK